jgi:protoporphyrinogen oxidase
VFTRRLAQAYPIYNPGYERAMETIENWLAPIPGFLSFGRQGLFAHDNTHHALFMAYRAVDCVEQGRLNASRWQEYRKVFATHVVED